ncbi:MAG: hypothetical protein ACO29C_06680 [Fluviibacter sp.]
MQLNFNAQQAQVLINLIDIAVKSAGLQAAEAGAFFSRVIQEAAAREKAEQDAQNPEAVEAPAEQEAA